jgi:DNA-binding NarL/FixJ family response regulator
VVLMDIRMPGTGGLEATRQIAADPELSGVRIIILTTFEADEYVFEAIRAGASGFLVKDTEPEDLPAIGRTATTPKWLIWRSQAPQPLIDLLGAYPRWHR